MEENDPSGVVQVGTGTQTLPLKLVSKKIELNEKTDTRPLKRFKHQGSPQAPNKILSKPHRKRRKASILVKHRG